MKVQIACLSLGVALAIAASPVSAADWGSGGIRDYGGAGGVPVPAPVPIPDYKPSWYFRLDAAIGVVNQPDVSEEGFKYGQLISGGNGAPGANGPDLLSSDSNWFNTDFNSFLTLGGGVGYYFGNGWRVDATIEKRSKDDISGYGTNTFDSHSYYDPDGAGPLPVTYGTDPNGVNGPVDRKTRLTFSDSATVAGTVWMANAYYDLTTTHGFTPYVGGGIGFVWNEISRVHNSKVESCDNEAVTPNNCASGDFNTLVSSTTASTRTDKVSLAAAAAVGFSYDISDMTAVDLGYRFLYLQGTSAAIGINGNESRLTIGDEYVHQLRAGLRFSVN